MSIIRSWRTFLAAALLVVAEGAAAQGDAGTELLKAAGDGDVLRIKALLADGAPLERVTRMAIRPCCAPRWATTKWRPRS